MKKRSLLGLLAVVPVLLAACGGGSSGDASVRMVNASPGYASLDLYVDDAKIVTGQAFGSVSDYTSASSGSVTAELSSTGGATTLLSKSLTLAKDTKYAVVTYGWEGAIKAASLAETQDAAASDKTYVRVLNTAVDAGDLDFYLTAEADSLSASTPLLATVAGGSQTTFAKANAGTFRLRVTAAGDASDVRLDVSNVVLPSTGVLTFILTPGSSGVLVNSLMLTQGGSLVQQLNTKARARLVAGMAAGGKVSLSVGSTSLGASTSSPTIRDYVLVTAGSVNLSTTVNGTALAPQTLSIAAGSDVSLVVSGLTATDASITPMVEDNRLPTVSTKVKLRLAHVAPTLKVDNLTMLLDYSPVASDLAFNTVSSYETVAANSTADIQVTAPSVATALFTTTDFNLISHGVYTVWVFDSASGTGQSVIPRRER